MWKVGWNLLNYNRTNRTYLAAYVFVELRIIENLKYYQFLQLLQCFQ